MKLIQGKSGAGPANRAEAWACVSANLAFPGSGSLAAGRPVGYWQLAVTVVGFLLTLISGIHLLTWMVPNWTRINSPTGDPVEILLTVWRQVRWPLAGVGVYTIALLWAGATSKAILSEHPKSSVPPPPPI